MKFRGLVVTAVVACAVGWAGRSVLSDDAPKPPDPMEMMRLGTPGEEHARLAKALEGDWTVHGKFLFGPAPMESDGTATFKTIFGGRYVQQDHASTFMGMPYEGRGIMGYDNGAKHYIASWIDNMGTGMMTSVGEESEKGKSWTFKSTHNVMGRDRRERSPHLSRAQCCDHFGRVVSGRPASAHGRWHGQSVGGSKRSGTAHPQSTRQRDFVCRLFS